RRWHIAARELVFTLSARFHTRELQLDGELDGLVIAKLKMQERDVSNTAPVATIKCFTADEIERGGHRMPVFLGNEEHAMFGHSFAEQREEVAVEVRRAPFARAGVLVAAEKEVPIARCDIRAAQAFDREAFRGALPFAADGLALLRGEIGEEIVKCR